MISRAKEAVTTHINREVGLNIATASTVIPGNTSGEGDEKGIDAQMERTRDVLGQTNIEVGHNQSEREALMVAEEAQCASEETAGCVRRAWDRGWRVTTMEPDVGGLLRMSSEGMEKTKLLIGLTYAPLIKLDLLYWPDFFLRFFFLFCKCASASSSRSRFTVCAIPKVGLELVACGLGVRVVETVWCCVADPGVSGGSSSVGPSAASGADPG
jgi:hypothetical protein